MAFVHNAFIEYRTPLFEKLSSRYNVKFFFEWFDSSKSKSKPSFLFQFLRSFKITKNYSFSPFLFFYLLYGRYNLFIAGAIGDPNTYIAFLVSRLLRKPFIFWDENWYLPRTKPRLLAWALMQYTINNSEAILVPGSKSRDFYLSINPDFRNKIFIAPNVSLLPQSHEIAFKADELKKALKLNGKKVILYCGRLIRQKGFDYLAKAFTKLQKYDSITFLLVVGGQYGCGEYYSTEELAIFQKSFGEDKINFSGWVESTEKAAYFSLADVVVVPSIFFAGGPEVWGFAVNEAMAAGKPVVATKAVGSAYDLIQNGKNGYIVPDKDPEALYKAISLILENSYRRRTMGNLSLKIIHEGFKYENMLMGFEQAIKSVLNSHFKKLDS